MIPLRDENPSGSTPVVTTGLIAINCATFVYELILGPQLRDFMFQWGMVPERVTVALTTHHEPIVMPALTFLTSMFLHGGWLHLIGNLWYLWIFGDNVEDYLGSVRYLVFYLAGGLFASLAHYFSAPSSNLPTVGASGAIAAVLGAYASIYPRARVVTLIPLVFYFQVVALPALAVLGLWFVFQFFSGTLALAGGQRADVAFWAHIGGFVFGALTVRLFGVGRARPAASRFAG